MWSKKLWEKLAVDSQKIVLVLIVLLINKSVFLVWFCFFCTASWRERRVVEHVGSSLLRTVIKSSAHVSAKPQGTNARCFGSFVGCGLEQSESYGSGWWWFFTGVCGWSQGIFMSKFVIGRWRWVGKQQPPQLPPQPGMRVPKLRLCSFSSVMGNNSLSPCTWPLCWQYKLGSSSSSPTCRWQQHGQ